MSKIITDEIEFSSNEDEELPSAQKSEVSAEERLALLEEEGDVAADYLEELLDIADLGGEFDIDVENDRATVEVVAADEDEERQLRVLVGRNGQVLEALQELTRLAVQTKTNQRSRLMLDIASFRANRKEQLREIALEAIAQVRETGEPVKLEAMNPFERKVCHDVVAEEGLVSDSQGAEPRRRVVIHPAEED